MNRKYVSKIFQQFAGDKSYFDFEDFKIQMREHPDMLAWFSKPEEAMTKRLNHSIEDSKITRQQMLDKV